jgi:hypothetical protein
LCPKPNSYVDVEIAKAIVALELVPEQTHFECLLGESSFVSTSQRLLSPKVKVPSFSTRPLAFSSRR